MKFANQKSFEYASPAEVINHLKNVERTNIKTLPSSLYLKTDTENDPERLQLVVSNGQTKIYDVRESFLMKLLKWYDFPSSLLKRLSIETILSVANDFLLNINSGYVNVKLENGEALTITSNRYTDIPDIDILELCRELKINTVTRNDFFMSMNTEMVIKKEPKAGDVCGFGINISNSETGFHSLRVSHYILRYWCSNGATVKINRGNQKSLIHYNINKNDAYKYIRDSVKKAEETQEIVFEKLKRLGDQKAEPVLDKTRQKLSGILGYQVAGQLMTEYKKKTEFHFKDFDGSRYSLFNFITNKAQKFDIYKRTQLEQMAGDFFLSENQERDGYWWNQIEQRN